MIEKYKVVGKTGDGLPYWQVVEMVSGIGEMWIKGVSLKKQEMIDLAEKLNKEATE